MLVRLLINIFTTHYLTLKTFNRGCIERIKLAITSSEVNHSGQIRFVVETSLPLRYILKNKECRNRAIEVFSEQRIWDTEFNNGVLIYLLMSEKSIEIVADRGINAKLDSTFWSEICRDLAYKFGVGDFEQGVLDAISRVDLILRQEFPSGGNAINELPDSPIIL